MVEEKIQANVTKKGVLGKKKKIHIKTDAK